MDALFAQAQTIPGGTMIGEYLLGAVLLAAIFMWTTGKLYGKPAVDLLKEVHARELADKDAQIDAWKEMALNATGLAETTVKLGKQVVEQKAAER